MTYPFIELEFDSRGRNWNPRLLDYLISQCVGRRATDLIILAHGFRSNVDNTTNLYEALLANLSPELISQQGRKFTVCGIYWPSAKFREAAGTALSVRRALASFHNHHPAAIGQARSQLPDIATSRGAQDRFVASVLSAFDDGGDDPAEGLPLLHQWRGSQMLERLSPRASRNTDADGGIENVAIPRSVLSGVAAFLNFMNWSAMKHLSGKVGEGLADCVPEMRRHLGDIRIHLVGHSLGGRVMASCCQTLGRQNAAPVASLTLLEAAFSHFGFSPDAGWGEPGFFRDVMESKSVRGPIISTFSKQDTVVGKAYAVASRLTRDSLQFIGDACDPYGGIGHNGAQRTPESTVVPLQCAGGVYRFKPGIITCLDGSGGLISGHSDITNPDVTYAIASAIRQAA